MPERLKSRRDFLAASKGYKAVRNTFVLQVRRRGDSGAAAARVGFSVSKRVADKAVERNRMRRRLKAAVDLARSQLAPDHDYVLIARRAALTSEFSRLSAELVSALHQASGRLSAPSPDRTMRPQC